MKSSLRLSRPLSGGNPDHHFNFDLKVRCCQSGHTNAGQARLRSVKKSHDLHHRDFLGLGPQVGHVDAHLHDIFGGCLKRIQSTFEVFDNDDGLLRQRPRIYGARGAPSHLAGHEGQTAWFGNGYLGVSDLAGVRQCLRIQAGDWSLHIVFLSLSVMSADILRIIDERESHQKRKKRYNGQTMLGSKVNDILIFLSVVETGSFVAGGKAFGLSRSTAGKAIARLEDGYGARLLNRTTRALDLTEEGRSLYEHGQAIRAAIEVADDSIAGEPGLPRGTLRVTAPDALGRRLLLPTVRRFLERWPDMQIEMSFSDRVDNVIEKGFDLSIRIGVRPPDQGFIVRTLLQAEVLLCASPSYFEMRDRPLNVEQLGRHDLLQFASRDRRQGWHLQEEDGTWMRAQGRVRLRLDSAEALREAALAGLGIAALPRLLVGKDIADGRLELVLPRVDPGTVPIIALYPHKRLLEPRVRRFIDMLNDDLRKSRIG